MSVQSEITRINDEVSSQTSLITQISSVLADKGGSGMPGTTTDDATPIERNTIDLQAVLDLANALPEATEINLQEKTVDPSLLKQEVTPDDGYDGLSKVTVNNYSLAGRAIPTIEVSEYGEITATTNQSEGYVYAGTETATKYLTLQYAKTITPSTTEQTAVAKGKYTTGDVVVAGDTNLVPENIAEGVSIFGVTGTHSGGASIETCTGTWVIRDPISTSSNDLWYTDGNLTTQTVAVEYRKTVTITAVKNSIIIMPTANQASPIVSNATQICSGTCVAVLVTDDGFSITT